MIHIILGKQGSGKTIYVVSCLYDAYLHGKTIYSNVHLKFPYKKLNYNDIIHCKLKNAVVFIDEVHQLLPARSSGINPVNRAICDSFLSMVRKMNLIIYVTSQTARKFDIRLWEEKDFVYMCKRFYFENNIWVEALHNQNLNPEIPILISCDIQEEISGNIINHNVIVNDFFKLYDTNQIIKIIGLFA